jgi:hypothetical protein
MTALPSQKLLLFLAGGLFLFSLFLWTPFGLPLYLELVLGRHLPDWRVTLLSVLLLLAPLLLGLCLWLGARSAGGRSASFWLAAPLLWALTVAALRWAP